MFFFPISFKTLLYSTKLSFIFSLYFVWKVEEKHFNTVFMLWRMKLSFMCGLVHGLTELNSFCESGVGNVLSAMKCVFQKAGFTE